MIDSFALSTRVENIERRVGATFRRGGSDGRIVIAPEMVCGCVDDWLSRSGEMISWSIDRYIRAGGASVRCGRTAIKLMGISVYRVGNVAAVRD